MTDVTIEGKLGKIVGRKHSLVCSTLGEVFAAIESNTGKLRKHFQRNKKRLFAIFVDGRHVDSDFLTEYSVKGKEVVILPILMGAVGFTIVSAIGAAAFGTFSAGFTALGFITAGVINAAFAFGLSLLISTLLAPDDPDIASTSSYVFGSPENVAEQGGPVPVGYGRLMVAGKIVSVNLFNVDRSRFDDSNFYNSLTQINSSTAEENLSFQDEGGAISS